jgi:GNAT superfamily N-acetyltransferase
MAVDIEVRQVKTPQERKAFVTFPWRVYQGDHNWVPPLISDQMDYLNPEKGAFFTHAQVALFYAQCEKEMVGTIAAFVDRHVPQQDGDAVGGFGFFELLDNFDYARALLNAACSWLRERGMQLMSGPTNFTDTEAPGVLIDGADCPPVMLEAHTPPYYQDFLERYGMEKSHDLYAWRAFRSQIGEELQNIPPDLLKVAEAARKASKVEIRKIRMEQWDSEIARAVELFNATLNHLPNFVPLSLNDFKRMADKMKMFLDPDLALFAEVGGKPIGFCVAIPDVNQVLIHLNGRLFPFNWLRVRSLIRHIDAVSFKLMGVLEEYRHRGIDAMLYLEAVKAIYRKGYAWLDGSVTSEYNPVVNLIAHRLGAEMYKHYRIYQIQL